MRIMQVLYVKYASSLTSQLQFELTFDSTQLYNIDTEVNDLMHRFL